MSLSKRERRILILASVVVAFAIVYNFTVKPFLASWNNAAAELAVRKVQFKRIAKLLKRGDDIIKNYNIYASSVNSVSETMGYIEKRAAMLDIKTDNIKPKLVDTNMGKECIIDLQIEGKVLCINKFISELIEEPVFVILKKCNLRSASNNPSFLKGTLTLSKLII